MTDNFVFLEAVPLILEQTLPDKFFGTSTAPTTTHGRVINHTRMASSDHVFELPICELSLGCTVLQLHCTWSLQGLFVYRWNDNAQIPF